MFAEQKILEFIYQKNIGDAKKILADMFPGELKELREKIEILLDLIETEEEKYVVKSNR